MQTAWDVPQFSRVECPKNANSLILSAIFIMAVQKAWDVPQFSSGGCAEPETSANSSHYKSWSDGIHERMNPAHNFYMRQIIYNLFSFMYIAPHWARLKNVHRDFIKVIKKWHSLCMSVSKMCITLLWRSSKCAPLFYDRFKKCIVTYEGHNQLQLLCMSASTMCITMLCRR